MRKLSDLDVFSRRVFLRADLDVPIIDGSVQELDRLQNLSSTISYLISQSSLILIAGHIGRPSNNKDFDLSTKNLVKPLSLLLNIEVVHFDSLENIIIPKNTLGLLENLRFWPEEEKNDNAFAQELASLSDVYVNEAFAASHRPHASIVSVPDFLPHAAGFRLQKEVEILTQVLKNPKHPMVVLIGGAKAETKIPVIETLAKIADFVLIGGKLPQEIKENPWGENVVLAKLTNTAKDLSPDSIDEFKEIISGAKMIIWNGPMGVFEEVGSEKGTKEIAEAVAASGAEKIVGGGETIWALKKYGQIEKMDWVSQGGGAMLEFLSGKTLPGILVLE